VADCATALGSFGANHNFKERRQNMGRSILLWLIGVPIPIIILIALFAR
jgi:hypothetical protein